MSLSINANKEKNRKTSVRSCGPQYGDGHPGCGRDPCLQIKTGDAQEKTGTVNQIFKLWSQQ